MSTKYFCNTGYHVYTITSHTWRLGTLTEVTLDERECCAEEIKEKEDQNNFKRDSNCFFQHGLTIAHVRVALTLASIILQGDSDLTIWSDTIAI